MWSRSCGFFSLTSFLFLSALLFKSLLSFVLSPKTMLTFPSKLAHLIPMLSDVFWACCCEHAHRYVLLPLRWQPSLYSQEHNYPINPRGKLLKGRPWRNCKRGCSLLASLVSFYVGVFCASLQLCLPLCWISCMYLPPSTDSSWTAAFDCRFVYVYANYG